MTTELLIQLTTSLLGTGGLITLFLIAEKKAAAQLQNAGKINEQWERIISRMEKDLASLNEKYETAAAKIEKLHDDNSDLRNRLDSVNTDCAVSKIMRCNCIGCTDRKPPFGTFGEQITIAADEK